MIVESHSSRSEIKRLFLVSVLAFILVLWGSPHAQPQQASSQSTKGDQSPATIAGGNITIIYYPPSEHSKPDLSLGVALYVYEKAFTLQHQTKTSYTEMRNLVSNCMIYRTEVNLPRGRSSVPEPGAWVLIKLRLENLSSVALTNLRIGIRASPYMFDKVASAPNVIASIRSESGRNRIFSTDVITVESLAPGDKAILTLQNEIDQKRYLEIREKPKHTITFPFIVSNQLKASGLQVVKFNASEMLKQEVELFTGERTIVNEQLEYRLLGPEEQSINEDLIKYEPLPPATKCLTGTAGVW